MKVSELARFFDHTFLKQVATNVDVRRVCREAIRYGFYGVCVPPSFVSYAKKLLIAEEVRVVTVIGFPLGYTTTGVKIKETKEAVADGADEIDMVINIGRLKMGDYSYIENEIRGVVEAADERVVKVIIETCYLTDKEKIKACELIIDAGAHFVKTSTGFGPEGAKVEDVKLLRKAAGGKIKVKAAGSINSYRKALKMIEAGADRIGSSSSVKIMEEALTRTQR